jgi:hypothetical protein
MAIKQQQTIKTIKKRNHCGDKCGWLDTAET